MIRRVTEADVDEVVGIFEPSFALLDFLPQLHTHEQNIRWFAEALREGEGYVLGRGFALVSGDWLSHLYVHPAEIGTGIGHALFEHVKTLRPEGFQFWVFQQNDRARGFYEAHGAQAVEFTDGAGNEEKTPDVRYEWRPARG
ncbi:MAG: putative acetyltransferase [Gaiellaceae bacterium]|jgi:GNAT superfamily N-acetyltransferase|nr:putative acetyltransferase [Gaiellaceae bacterium]